LKVRYPRLRRSDCAISTAIADVNAHGQSQVRLSWVWAAHNGWEGEVAAAENSMLDDDRLMECKLYSSDMVVHYLSNSLSDQLDASEISKALLGRGVAKNRTGDGLDNTVFHASTRHLVLAPGRPAYGAL
jgi:hypothetical protein